MPETMFRVRWPNGDAETCYSPSTIIRDFYEVGRSYTPAEFLAASRDGLSAASERVRMRYGAGCSPRHGATGGYRAPGEDFGRERGRDGRRLHGMRS